VRFARPRSKSCSGGIWFQGRNPGIGFRFAEAVRDFCAVQARERASVITAGSAADAWFIDDGRLHFANRKTLVESIARQRKRAAHPARVNVGDGGPMSCCVDRQSRVRCADRPRMGGGGQPEHAGARPVRRKGGHEHPGVPQDPDDTASNASSSAESPAAPTGR
jgi:hypothetical protein